MTYLIVDGMNVIGSRPDGWWRDRDGAVRRLLERLQRFHVATGDTVTLVLDGRPLPDVAEGTHGGVRVLYADRPGPDAADDGVVELLEDAADPSAACVVSSDRALRERVRALGSAVLGAAELLERLDQL